MKRLARKEKRWKRRLQGQSWSRQGIGEFNSEMNRVSTWLKVVHLIISDVSLKFEKLGPQFEESIVVVNVSIK